jgi:hypothetical protein
MYFLSTRLKDLHLEQQTPLSVVRAGLRLGQSRPACLVEHGILVIRTAFGSAFRTSPTKALGSLTLGTSGGRVGMENGQ